MVDRSSFDRIIQAGGYISVNTGNAVDANATLIEKDKADASFASATCIGCGACVAACKNSSALLFVSAKVSHLALLPQGYPERKTRVHDMIAQMDKEGFGSCTSTGACEAVCPKEISITNIARLNNEYGIAGLTADH
jgi:succinate dehydrogenase / fumarate reductase iron-sulfur subunit